MMIVKAAQQWSFLFTRARVAALVAAVSLMLLWVPMTAAQLAPDDCPAKYTIVEINVYQGQCTVIDPIEVIAPEEAVKFINNTEQEIIVTFDDETSPFLEISFGVPSNGKCYTARSAADLGIGEENPLKQYLYTAKPLKASQPCGQIGDARPRIVVRSTSTQESVEE